MIAADTSTWIAFFAGERGEDVQILDKALADRQVLMVPAVLAELLSDSQIPVSTAESLKELPLMQIETGYWQRAGELRARVLAKGRKARLGDAHRTKLRGPRHPPADTRPRLSCVRGDCGFKFRD